VELPKKSFSRTVTEFAVIVLSVLVALGFESWREDVGEHELELEYLERLKSEFHVDAARIATAIKASPIQQSHIDSALTVLTAGGSSTKHDLLSVFMASRSVWSRQIGATFRELLGTGQLRLVHNTDLRDRLVGFYSWIGVAIVSAPGLRDRLPYRDIVRGEISPDLQEIMRACGGEQARTLALPDLNMVTACNYVASEDEVASTLARIRSNPETLPALRRWAAAFSALGDRLGEVQRRVIEMELLIAEELALN
jgi:hypothetical protein